MPHNNGNDGKGSHAGEGEHLALIMHVVITQYIHNPSTYGFLVFLMSACTIDDTTPGYTQFITIQLT
jgi:hypothetical protein